MKGTLAAALWSVLLCNALPANEFWINYDYFDEARAIGQGTVHMFTAGIADASQAATISQAIDELFANSGQETLTQSEREWRSARNRQIGQISIFVNAIAAASLFTLLIITAHTMAQSVRQRARTGIGLRQPASMRTARDENSAALDRGRPPTAAIGK